MLTHYTALLAAIFVAIVGILIIWSNPARAVNRAVFSCSLHISIWLALLHVAVGMREGLFWLRLMCGFAAWVPLQFALVKESISRGEEGFGLKGMKRNWGVAIICTALAVIAFTDWFIPSHSTSANKVYGAGYYTYMIGVLGLYALVLLAALRGLGKLTGSNRLELQVWLGGGTAMAVSILVLMALNAAFHNPRFVLLQPIVVLVFYGGTVLAITNYRIFNARQLLVVVLEKGLLVALVAGAAFALDLGLNQLFPDAVSLFITTAAALWVAAELSKWLDRLFRFYPEATAARQAAFAASRRELRIEGLEKAFLEVLKGWGQAERGLILIGNKGSFTGHGVEIPEDCPVGVAMRQLRWATPERLARERSTPEREAVAKFLEAHKLGVLVIGEGPTLSALIGVGVPASRRPFTYPQVTQLQELASIMENAMERAHFSVKAQHAEQLATVGLLGASLAHEIRNPLVTIKTFVQLLPRHHQDETFRTKFFGLIGEEVARIDRLTEQLMDLASPRAYRAQDIDLHPVLRASLELVVAKATDKRINFLTDFRAAPDRAQTDASAVKQVLLNLCFNAIQAVESQEGERWVKVSTRNVDGGVEMLVEDSGPGIAQEIRPRLFQPFQSTKSSGFGLGLAICSDILAGLDATIAVDPSVPGRGAAFRIVFPCPAS